MENKPGRLPEGVGKKIVEALKQDNIEIKENQQVAQDEFVESVGMDEQDESNGFEVFGEGFMASDLDESAETAFSESSMEQEKPFSPAFSKPKQVIKSEANLTEVEMPANVDILKRLITQLPPGVTRQTGAQIIRQTMEAMGISMKSVLQEAQFIQEELGHSAKDCLNTVEEYKNNIRLLERKVQNYKKQANQLGELINLFIMSEKNR